MPAPKENVLIRIVDDDEEVRNALSFMLACKGWKTECHASAGDFLKNYRSTPPGCLLLDIRMPGMSGLELQTRMKEMNLTLPIIFITGHADVPTAVRTLKMGAFDFLEKPVDAEALEAAIEAASEISLAQSSGGAFARSRGGDSQRNEPERARDHEAPFPGTRQPRHRRASLALGPHHSGPPQQHLP